MGDSLEEPAMLKKHGRLLIGAGIIPKYVIFNIIRMYKEALQFITKHHSDQKRYNGNLFIIHPIRVSQEVTGDKQKVIALLHDVVEDTDVKLKDLEIFGSDVVASVEALTHRKGESYVDYIKRVKMNEDAIQVKIADIADNLKDSPSDNAIRKSSIALDMLINKS